RGVVSDLKTLGQCPDGDRPSRLEPLHLQQHEILLRLDTSRPRRQLSLAQEAADLVAKVGQRGVVDLLAGAWALPSPTRINPRSLYHEMIYPRRGSAAGKPTSRRAGLLGGPLVWLVTVGPPAETGEDAAQNEAIEHAPHQGRGCRLSGHVDRRR